MDRYGSVARQKPPEFVELIAELMKPAVQREAASWIQEHPEEVNTVIREVLAGGIVGAIVGYITERFETPIVNLREELKAKGLVDK